MAADALDLISPVSAKADDEGEQPKPKEKQRRKKQVGGTFQSTPAESTADARCGGSRQGEAASKAQKEIESAMDQEIACVFESQPTNSRADSGTHLGDSCPGRSRVAAARALIEAAAHASEQGLDCVFESKPRMSTADVVASGAGRPTTESFDSVGAGSSVFESAPSKSSADALHGTGPRHAEAAEATILAAAEQAHMPAGVFESRPESSKADVAHGSGNQSRAAQNLIKRVADGVATGRMSGVFESQPSKSTASVGYGREAAESSEYETDDEEEEGSASPAPAAAAVGRPLSGKV